MKAAEEKKIDETIPGGRFIQGGSIVNAEGVKIGSVEKDGSETMFEAMEPLTFEEAQKRVAGGDYSDEVLKSLKLYQTAHPEMDEEKADKKSARNKNK